MIIIVVIIAIIIVIIVFLAIRTKRIKDEYKVRGEDDRAGERGEGGGEREGRYIEVERGGGSERKREREREKTIEHHMYAQVTTGEVNWDYDWDRNMPYIAPGMVEGKEPLLDEWEVKIAHNNIIQYSHWPLKYWA